LETSPPQGARTDNGAHLWTENYDRQLTDVFAIQEEIAQAIAGALRVPLGLGRGETLVRNRTSDLESYDQYLRARALIRARAPIEAIKVLEPGVVRDPDFAPTWALLAQAYVLLPAWNPGMRLDPIPAARLELQASQGKAENAAREAVRLDPRSADGYTAQALVQAVRGNWAAAESHYLQALALDPNDPDALHHYRNMLDDTGRLQDALGLRQKLRTLEPFVPIFNIVTAAIMLDNRQQQAAIPILEPIPADAAGGYYRNLILAQAYAAHTRYAEAADALLAIRTNLGSRQSVEDAARLLRVAPTTGSASQALPLLEGELGFVYAHIGAMDRVLEFYERTIGLNNVSVNGIRTIWLPQLAPARKTDRFKAAMRASGLVDYWRARGWPDLCRPMGTGDFICD
jgi:tetratricopeptide (TPR) repeat protein